MNLLNGFTPINDRVLLTPSVSQLNNSAIALPETYAARTSSCNVLAVGPKVKLGINVGDHVLCESNFSDRSNLKDGKNFLCMDKKIFAKVVNKKVFPLGRNILIRRDLAERSLSKIVYAVEGQRSTDQSDEGWIEAFGILDRKKKEYWKSAHALKLGQKVRLDGWHESMIELGIGNEYYLIVHENHILYAYD